MDFSTKDRDNDPSEANCASDLESGWWYKDCKESDLNGPYRHPLPPTTDIPPHVRWNSWKSSSFYSMKRVKMSIRPVDFCVNCTTGAGWICNISFTREIVVAEGGLARFPFQSCRLEQALIYISHEPGVSRPSLLGVVQEDCWLARNSVSEAQLYHSWVLSQSVKCLGVRGEK